MTVEPMLKRPISAPRSRSHRGLGVRPPGLTAPGRGDLAGPDGLHAADEDGPHQDQGHGAGLRLEQADHPLVAGEQPRHGAGGDGVDAEQAPGDVAHGGQGPGQGHVDAVIVPRGQVDGGEGPVGEAGGGGGIAQQVGGGEVVALGLDQGPAADGPAAAHGPVRRAQQGRLRGQGPGLGAQGAGEEGVEAGVGGGVALHRLAHVHPELGDEPVDQGVLEGAPGAAGEAVHQGAQGVLRQQVLEGDEEALAEGQVGWAHFAFGACWGGGSGGRWGWRPWVPRPGGPAPRTGSPGPRPWSPAP